MDEGAFSVAVEGACLFGETTGLGTPLVLLHGMAGDRHEWDRLLTSLPANLATLRYDLRGFGRSEFGDGPDYAHADDLLAVLDACQIARASILGLSAGGSVALNFALSHPQRVSQLVLISPWIAGWEASDEWKSLWRGVTGAARGGDMALARQRWFDHPMFAMLRRDPDDAVELRFSIERYHGRQWIEDNQRDELPDIDRLHTLAMPTLLLTGEQDFQDLRLIADLIEAAAPDVKRIDFADTGHMVHIERLREAAQAIASFVTSPDQQHQP